MLPAERGCGCFRLAGTSDAYGSQGHLMLLADRESRFLGLTGALDASKLKELLMLLSEKDS
jgi:hypothetical protein